MEIDMSLHDLLLMIAETAGEAAPVAVKAIVDLEPSAVSKVQRQVNALRLFAGAMEGALERDIQRRKATA